ncbi:MAG: MoaD/ThiS family protein [Gammaproteobacteria bacterium]|nr:MoaD/ThiS family protein [Gammaproteobacteria bacterium]
MKARILLHGALREADPAGRIELDVPAGCSIGELRERLVAHVREHAPGVGEDLLRRSAFGTRETILHDHEPVPEDGELAVLPPVGGG